VAHHECRPAQARDGHGVVLAVIEPLGVGYPSTYLFDRLFRSAVAQRQDAPVPGRTRRGSRIAEFAIPPRHLVDVCDLEWLLPRVDEQDVAYVEHPIGDARLVPDGG